LERDSDQEKDEEIIRQVENISIQNTVQGQTLKYFEYLLKIKFRNGRNGFELDIEE